jgi:hypothetical protein
MAHSSSFGYRDLLAREHRYSLATGALLLLLGFVADHFAGLYALSYLTRATSVYVGDLLLDNLPVVNLNLVVIEGALWAIAISCILVMMSPRKILFTLKALGLLIIIRAFFISLTHIGIYPGQINPGAGYFDAVYSYFNLQTGFFFSGHTSFPFLMALIFWEDRPWRYAYLALSVIFGVSVLLAHVHYSIDVFAAPFMAYGVFEITRLFFPRDYKLIRGHD